MKKISCLAIIALFFNSYLYAATNYVSKTGSNISPYDTWNKAARSIQLAVSAADPGNTVLVNDGTYTPVLAVEIVKEIIVKSVNGPEKTIVDGGGNHRCFSLVITNPSLNIAVIDGFKMTNGYLGAAYCVNATIQNCVVVGSYANLNAGGLFVTGSKILNCKIVGNNSGAWGGGISASLNSTIRNCLFSGNVAKGNGGGGYFYGAAVENCTFVNNYATNQAGGIYFGDSNNNTLINSIVWGNNSDGETNNIAGTITTNIYNCIEDWADISNGIITNYPDFSNPDSENFTLESFSKCVDSGTNQIWMSGAYDLEGNERIYNKIVDMGAYEFIPEPASLILGLGIFAIVFRKRGKN